MQIPKKFFHDRAVLLLLSVNTFLALMGVLLILLRLDSGQGDGYIVQYRANLGLSAFKSGGSGTFFSFVAFFILVWAFHTVFSARVYPVRHYLGITVLTFGSLLLLLGMIVSNALLVLR